MQIRRCASIPSTLYDGDWDQSSTWILSMRRGSWQCDQALGALFGTPRSSKIRAWLLDYIYCIEFSGRPVLITLKEEYSKDWMPLCNDLPYWDDLHKNTVSWSTIIEGAKEIDLPLSRESSIYFQFYGLDEP